jgi:hypothetical protein
MKVTVRDTAALHALKPLETAAYLRSKGWRKDADLNGKGNIWLLRSEADEDIDVTLPLHRDLADYTLRMGELLHTLSYAEQRSELDILRDLQTTAADLIRIRASSREAESGSLPLERAVNFVERSRDMMLAAACAALIKRSVYANRKHAQAMKYLDRARMGQTEHGSYVLTILSPVTPELRATQSELRLQVEPSEPYERMVTHTLIDALAALGDAAREAALQEGSMDMRPFEAAVPRGVSANLCEAVVGLSTVGSDGALDVQVAWSRSRPAGGNLAERVFLDSDSIRIIEEAGRRFRATSTIDDYEVQGSVMRLERGADATEGDVTIMAYIDDQPRRVVVRLGPENYSQAVQAHDERRLVACAGDLAREGKIYRLQSPRRFEVLGDDLT